MTRRLLVLAVNLVLILAALFGAEVYLRARGYQPYVRTFPGQYENDREGVFWAKGDPVLGWISYNIDPETNLELFSDPTSFGVVDVAPGKTRIMLLGDSFIWGAGVAVEDGATALISQRLEDTHEVFNLSAPGWGVDQMYLAYRQYRDVLRPHIVILAFIDDDVARVLEAYRIAERLNKPSFDVEDGELVSKTSAPGSQRLLRPILARSVLFSRIVRQVYLATDARDVVRYIFRDVAREARLRNEEFVVVRIPTLDHFHKAARIQRRIYGFEGVLNELDVPYLDLANELTQTLNWDREFYLDEEYGDAVGHLSAAGHRYLADRLIDQVSSGTGTP